MNLILPLGAAMNQSEIAISVVIPVRNEADSVGALIASLRAQTRLPEEVVFVDGGSTDRTGDIIRELTAGDVRFRLVEAGPATPGRGRNVGIAAARHEWIALTDTGITLEAKWLEALTRVAEREPALDVVYGSYDPVVDGFFRRCAALAYVPTKQDRGGARTRGPSIASCLVRRKAWRAVGGFPDLRAAEDLIFMERLQQQGFRCGWAPEAVVYWQLPPTLGQLYRRFVLYSKHNVWADRQRYWHYGIARMYLLALPLLLLAILHSPWWLVAVALGAVARVGKTIWQKREGRGLIWALNPIMYLGVGAVLATIDFASLVGWLQAVCQKSPAIHPPELDGLPTAGMVTHDSVRSS